MIAADGMKVTALPLLEVGRTVLVAAAPDEPPWRMVVDVVQDGQITLATVDDEQLPREWHEIRETHITTLDRFSVHLIHIPVLRVGDTRMVIGTPDADTPVQRRAYARISVPVAARCMLLDPEENRWIPFDAEVRDLGGGGLSLVANILAPDGATLAMSLMLDGPPVVVMGKVLPREALPTIGRALIRVEYVLIRESDRDRILRFVLLSLAGRRHAQQLS